MSLADGIAWEKDHPTEYAQVYALEYATRLARVRDNLISSLISVFGRIFEYTWYEYPHDYGVGGISMFDPLKNCGIVFRYEKETGRIISMNPMEVKTQ